MSKRSNKYMLMGKVAYFISAAMMIAALVTNLLPPQAVFAKVDEPKVNLSKSADPSKYSYAGDVISYSYKVENKGKVELTGISVTDDKATVDCGGVTTLAVGASMTCTASYTILAGDITAASVTNVATVVSNAPTETDSATVNYVEDKKVTICHFTNESASHLYNEIGVSIKSVASAADWLNGHGGEPNDIWPEFTAKNGDLIGAHGDQSILANHCEVVPPETPAVSLSKSADPSKYSYAGDVISYSYLVTNTGNVALTGVTVTDNKATVSCPSNTVAVGASMTCTASYTILAGDITATSVTNTATVTSNAPTKTATATVTYEEDKKVTICHFVNENASHLYNEIDVSINSVASAADWLNGHGGHEDIWPEFTAKNGETIDEHGDQTILANHCVVVPPPITICWNNVTYTDVPVADLVNYPGYTEGACTPSAASVSAGACAWAEQAGSLTLVTITLTGATLTINGTINGQPYTETFNSSGSTDLPPGTYTYSWTALSGYIGGGSGTLVVGDCSPGNGTASISTGACSWTLEAGSLTSVTINLNNASLTINGVTYTSSTTIYLPPGTYDYTWTALPGYTGSGGGTVVISDCAKENGTADVATLACTWNAQDGSLTPVVITLDHASFTINGVTYFASTTIYLPPGTYPYRWEALPGYEGSGHGVLKIGGCVPPAVPSINVSCYSLEYHAYRINISNSGPAGEIGYSTNLDATIISLGVIASGGSVQISVPSTATTLNVYPMGPNGWGTPIQVALSTLTTGICEDPLGLSSFCSNPLHGWTVTNLNPFAVEFTWVYGLLNGGPIPLAVGAAYTFTTADQPGAVMQIFADGILMASGAPAAPCPTEPPLVDACQNLEGEQANVPDGYQLDNGNCVPVQLLTFNPVVIPVTGPAAGPTILIPVTGVDMGMLGRTLPGTLFGLSFSFAGLGLLLCGFARRRDEDLQN